MEGSTSKERVGAFRPCENCGEEFWSRSTGKGKVSRFCKMACFHEHRSRTFRAMIAERTEKACIECGVVKPLDEFHIGRAYADGHNNVCKPCQIVKSREYALRSLFGITQADYDAMLEAQGGVCTICGEPCKSGRNLAIDHDHETGEVRELLCSGCNTGIGNFRENATALENAAVYIRRHKENK